MLASARSARAGSLSSQRAVIERRTEDQRHCLSLRTVATAAPPFDLGGLYLSVDATRRSAGPAMAVSRETGVPASTIRRMKHPRRRGRRRAARVVLAGCGTRASRTVIFNRRCRSSRRGDMVRADPVALSALGARIAGQTTIQRLVVLAISEPPNGHVADTVESGPTSLGVAAGKLRALQSVRGGVRAMSCLLSRRTGGVMEEGGAVTRRTVLKAAAVTVAAVAITPRLYRMSDGVAEASDAVFEGWLCRQASPSDDGAVLSDPRGVLACGVDERVGAGHSLGFAGGGWTCAGSVLRPCQRRTPHRRWRRRWARGVHLLVSGDDAPATCRPPQ